MPGEEKFSNGKSTINYKGIFSVKIRLDDSNSTLKKELIKYLSSPNKPGPGLNRRLNAARLNA